MARQEWGCQALQTVSCLGALTFLGTYKSWDAGQLWKSILFPGSVEPSGARDLQAVVGVVCTAGPPGASHFEAVHDADYERTPGPGKMQEHIYQG